VAPVAEAHPDEPTLLPRKADQARHSRDSMAGVLAVIEEPAAAAARAGPEAMLLVVLLVALAASEFSRRSPALPCNAAAAAA
jgi:hypothetical protein